MRPKRRQMCCNTGLVIGAAAAVESPVALRRFERGRHPLTMVPFGLHVMVGVQQHGGRTRWRRIPGDDRRRAALADDAHIVKTGLRQQFYDRLRAAVYLVAPAGVGPHRFDPHQVLEVAAHRGQHLADPLNQISHGLEASERGPLSWACDPRS